MGKAALHAAAQLGKASGASDDSLGVAPVLVGLAIAGSLAGLLWWAFRSEPSEPSV